jgi:hypothetical protein
MVDTTFRELLSSDSSKMEIIGPFATKYINLFLKEIETKCSTGSESFTVDTSWYGYS